jgi:hypothetical protein
MAQTPVLLNGRMVGAVLDRELVKRVKGSKHMLRVAPRGWAVDDQVLTIARTLGAERVRIVDTETGVNYVADMTAFDAHGVTVNYGYGNQIALPLQHWRKQGGDEQPQAAAVGMAQAALFA